MTTRVIESKSPVEFSIKSDNGGAGRQVIIGDVAKKESTWEE